MGFLTFLNLVPLKTSDEVWILDVSMMGIYVYMHYIIMLKQLKAIVPVSDVSQINAIF